MAKNYKLTIQPVKVLPTLTKEVLNLDPDKATAIKEDMVKNFNIVKTSLTNVQSYLTKAASMKAVSGKLETNCTTLASKCKTMATNSGNRVSGLKSKFDADVKEFTIQMLSTRVATLEKLVAQMNDND